VQVFFPGPVGEQIAWASHPPFPFAFAVQPSIGAHDVPLPW
jgi:hypothetical protein